jgi:hypothetical protein
MRSQSQPILAKGQTEAQPSAARRDADTLASIAAEVRGFANSKKANSPDLSERDAMLALADRAEHLQERLQAIIDWADFAMKNPGEFNDHGVRNLDGPVFDEARVALATVCGVCGGNRFIQTQPHPTSPPDDEFCPACDEGTKAESRP